jgi:hypothetical protein
VLRYGVVSQVKGSANVFEVSMCRLENVCEFVEQCVELPGNLFTDYGYNVNWSAIFVLLELDD